jgi:hypothetical protein
MERFADARSRINWAKKDVANFERCAKRFFKNTKPALITELEPDGIHELHKFRLGKKLPTALTQNTITACEHLRAALDLLAVKVARLANVPDELVRYIHFPFSATVTDFKSRLNGKACQPLPDGIKTLFASYEPYAGGSDLLWAINELANTSKHDSIIHVGFKSGVALPFLETTDALHLPIEIMEGVTDSAENEIVFARTQSGLKWKYHLQIAFGISFGKIERIEGKEIQPNLVGMVKAVTTIVNETEAKCLALGLFN